MPSTTFFVVWSLVLICRRPTCDLVAVCDWQCSATCSVSRRRICDGSLAYSVTRNANRIDAIFKSFIRNMDRVVLLEYQFSLAPVLVMRYVTRKKKLRRWELGESTGCDQCFKSEKSREKLSCYVIHSVADLCRRCSRKLLSSPTIAGLPAKLNSAQLRRQTGGQCLGQITCRR